jgi:hypothetical protein
MDTWILSDTSILQKAALQDTCIAVLHVYCFCPTTAILLQYVCAILLKGLYPWMDTVSIPEVPMHRPAAHRTQTTDMGWRVISTPIAGTDYRSPIVSLIHRGTHNKRPEADEAAKGQAQADAGEGAYEDRGD